jgi:DNA polymerase III alpha subunit
VNGILSEAAKALGLPTVATNDVHFMKQEDAAAQLYLECVRRGRTYEEALPNHHGSSEMYLKSPVEMLKAFSDFPEAVQNSLRVAEMCQGVELKLGTPMLPNFPVPEGHTIETYFRKVSEDGLEERFKSFQQTGFQFDPEVYRLLSDRVGLHQVLEKSGYSGRSWPWIRRGIFGGLFAGHHGSRSAAVQLAL